jgi:hypothetical protein
MRPLENPVGVGCGLNAVNQQRRVFSRYCIELRDLSGLETARGIFKLYRPRLLCGQVVLTDRHETTDVPAKRLSRHSQGGITETFAIQE